MIKLIIEVEGQPVFNPEVRMFAPFKALLERDKGRNSLTNVFEKGDADGRKKYISTKELAFIYWFADPRSPYKESYKEEDLRTEKLKRLLALPEVWKIDELVRKAIDFYEAEIKEDFDIQYFESSLNAARKTKEYFDNVDYNLTDNKGQKIYKVKEVTDALSKSSNVIETLKVLREKVYKSETLARKVRGGGAVGRFEE